jgi:hypothetical protein
MDNKIAIRISFEKAGIEFIGSPDQGAGVRWKLTNQ